MSDSIESALVIRLAGTLPWSAALPPLNQFTGTLTGINPAQPFSVTSYARRDREFQHRDMINAAAVASVAIMARTVWNGTVDQPILQGVTRVTDQSGTNVILPLDPSAVGSTLPNGNTAVTYVLNADIPYAAIQVTDVNLYNRDLMLYETLARAAAVFSPDAPIHRIDSAGTYVGSTSVWATAQGINNPKVPNAAEPLSRDTIKNPDAYLAERDNQVAAYVARVVQALKNPFPYATRLYVQVTSPNGGDAEESETYVLTNNVFTQGNTYTAGEQVIYLGEWYQANVTTTDTPPSASWTAIPQNTQLQFLADPSLDSRNRIIYDTGAKTLQWFRQTLDLVHVPQIVGFLIPGILPSQIIKTVAAIPERKDAQFYRQKASRIQYSTGTYNNAQVFSPTGNRDPSATYVNGATSTLFLNSKNVTLTVPDTFTVNFKNIYCPPGTYELDCLVRPCPAFDIAGGDNQQGNVDTDGGTTFNTVGDVRNWQVALPAGGWQLFIEFSNTSATSTTAFGIKASQGSTSILANTLPLYYTDASGNALPQNTVISSPPINLQSTGQSYNFSVQWTAGVGQLHVTRLRFQQVNGPDTSHYIMQAAWLNSVSNNSTQVIIPGGNAIGVTPTGDGGVDFSAFNSPLTWLVSLPTGNWQMVINYSDSQSDNAIQFNVGVTQPGLSPQFFTLPYTDASNSPLPVNTNVTSQSLGVISTGSAFNLSISWLPPSSGPNGRFHIRDLTFTLASSQNSVSQLDVIGQANIADVMPFHFYLSGTDLAPQLQVTWLPKSASLWTAKPYNVGDQVLYNLIYWQATAAASATDIPGQSAKWTQLSIEPQIPLIFEQIQLTQLVSTVPTPEVVGYQGFRQDMLERALRADEDAYSIALRMAGTTLPEFRDSNNSWTPQSTDAWMSFMEVYSPRLRQKTAVPSGGILVSHQYEAITQGIEYVRYGGKKYSNGAKFYGIYGTTAYATFGQPIVNQVGAYTLAAPGDIGKTGLIPAGIEYVRTSGTGTTHGWYPSYASYPTHQAIQPWMIEQGFYVASNDLQSPDGNPVPPAGVSNGTDPVRAELIYIPAASNLAVGFVKAATIANGLIYGTDGIHTWSTSDGFTFNTLGSTSASKTVNAVVFASSLFVAAGTAGYVSTSTDSNTWTDRTSGISANLLSIAFGAGVYVAVGSGGAIIKSANGTSWTTVSTGSSDFHQVIFANSIFMAVGAAGVIYTSADGATWTLCTTGSSNTFTGVTYGNGMFATINLDGKIYLSADSGVTWTTHSVSNITNPAGIAFGNNQFIIGSLTGSVYISRDNALSFDLLNNSYPSHQSATVVYYTGSAFVIGQSS